MLQTVPAFGEHLRGWRKRRRLSQLDLALRAEVSARHLGFVEIGRSRPSRALVLRLAEELEVPLRERNVWLVAAGFAPQFRETALGDVPLEVVRSAIEATIDAHKPFPAFAIDRYWNVVASNAALPELYEGVRSDLLQAPVNVLRLTLHPEGLAPRILNLEVWAAHLLARLRREVELTADSRLHDLLTEAETLQPPPKRGDRRGAEPSSLAIPLCIETVLGRLSFFSTTTVFGTPLDVTVSEIALEMLYPGDEETRLAVRARPPAPPTPRRYAP